MTFYSKKKKEVFTNLFQLKSSVIRATSFAGPALTTRRAITNSRNHPYPYSNQSCPSVRMYSHRILLFFLCKQTATSNTACSIPYPACCCIGLCMPNISMHMHTKCTYFLSSLLPITHNHNNNREETHDRIAYLVILVPPYHSTTATYPPSKRENIYVQLRMEMELE